jgi:hypothetical protein
MKILLLKYNLTIKVLAIFIQQVNYKKFIKRLLLGLRSICTKPTMQELVLNFLMNKHTCMTSLLHIFVDFSYARTRG